MDHPTLEKIVGRKIVVDEESDDGTPMLLFMMVVPGTPLRAFVLAKTRTTAKACVDKFVQHGGRRHDWAVEDFFPVDAMPFLICVFTGATLLARTDGQIDGNSH